MSVKLSKRLSSKKRKFPQKNAQAEILQKLGLEAFWTTPLDPASMLDISTWTQEKKAPLKLQDLPHAFLQRLWLLSPDARSPRFQPVHDNLNSGNDSPEDVTDGLGDSECAVNSLDLVTAVFMSANTFLQQEMTARMVQCQFAVPLVLPDIDPEDPSRFLLWPLRGVVSQWRSHFPDCRKVHGGDLASTYMPLISCVKLGRCGISKSQVLNSVINGLRFPSETFLHRGMDGGQLPRRLSNGLVEIGWYLPTGDRARDTFPVPVVISNLRGDASSHEKNLILLCQASSAVVIFCGNLREKERQLLASCKDIASKLILIDVSDTEMNENRVVGFADQNLEQVMGLPQGSVLQGGALSEGELASRLCDTLKDFLPDKLKLVTLEEAAKLAEVLGLNVDEGAVCKKAMATADEVLKGLDEGSAQFKQKQLPLQGPLWSKLAEIAKQERKHKAEGKDADPKLQKEKKDIFIELNSYKMTSAMKIFTDALFTADKVERTCFLTWMKLKLQMMQMETQNTPQDQFTNGLAEGEDGLSEHHDELVNGANHASEDSDSFCTDSSFEEEPTEDQSELRVPEEESEMDEELKQASTKQTIESHLEPNDQPDSSHDTLIEQQIDMTPDDNEFQGEEVTEKGFEKTISEHDHQSGENGSLSEGSEQDEPQQTISEPDLVSADEQLTQDVSLELEVASSSNEAPSSLTEEATSSNEVASNSAAKATSSNEVASSSTEEAPSSNEVPSSSNEVHSSSTEEVLCSNEVASNSATEVTSSNEVASNSNEEALSSNEMVSNPTEETSSSNEEAPSSNEVPSSSNELHSSSTEEVLCSNEVDSNSATEVTSSNEVASSSNEEALSSNEMVSSPTEETSSSNEEAPSSNEVPSSSNEVHSSSTEEISCSNEVDSNSATEVTSSNEVASSSTEEALSSNEMVPSLTEEAASSNEEPSCSDPDPSSLGIEHFLREMGLIFELTHVNPGSGTHNVLRLPSIAADLLLYGIPLELMDGDAANIPIHWLSCIFAELKRRLPQEKWRTRVLTTLGGHHARNAEVLSALFGVKFPDARKRSTRGVYMVALHLPDHLRKNLQCDFLLLMDVEGLCTENTENTLIHDNEMATFAARLSDILMQNICSHAGTEFETNFTVTVNALLRTRESGSMPICHLFAQDDELSSVLQVSQLRRVCDVLQTETGERGNSPDNHYAKTSTCITSFKWPWHNISIAEPLDARYSKEVLQLKQKLLDSLKICAAKSAPRSLPILLSHLLAGWDAVKAESFSIGLQNTDKALAFSLLCTELSQWEDRFLDHMDSWLTGATKKIVATKAKALDTATQNSLLSELKDQAKAEVETGVDKLKSKIDTYMTRDGIPNMDTYKPVLMSNMDDLQARIISEIVQRLDTINENHCSSTQLNKFEILLEEEQESKLHSLIENSRSTKVLLQDEELEEEFGGMWEKILSNFDFRPSETDDITPRVTEILKQNLISRRLQKHIKKLEDIGKIETSTFYVYDEHFGYRSRLKHMFEDNNRVQREDARQLASKIIDEYFELVANKSSSPADFSDSYITELLGNIENALKEKPLDIRSAFEVDLKVYLCSAACRDFQKLHDRYAKDTEFLACITAAKSKYLAEFIYQFRKKDQCWRVAQAFASMVIKPIVMEYIYKPLGMRIAEEIQEKDRKYQSRRAFHKKLLEELIKEDSFDSFQEYLHSYDNFRLKKIQETVMAHLSESTNFEKWRQQRLGEIVGKIAAAVSETAEGTSGVLSDTKPLLERVCLILEKDGDVDVNRAPLNGPLFSITTEWDRFVTCLMELLAAMRLDLAQEFSQNVDITQFLQCLPTQPEDYLFKRLRGCDKQCPHCRAPCELEEMQHDVHGALLHRPKGVFTHHNGKPGQSKDTDDMSVTCTSLLSLNPDWSISPEGPNSQTASDYWRYVLARFSVRFATEYEQEPSTIPDTWRKITMEEALHSLKEAYSVQ